MKTSRIINALAACVVVAGLSGSTLFAQNDSTNSSDLAAQDESGFLAGLTEAVAANPDNAAEIVKAALQLKLDDINNTPSLANDIILAVIAGLPEGSMTPEMLADILDAAVGVLKALPVDKSNVAPDAVRAVLASLPPELAQSVKNLVLSGPEGGLRDDLTAIFTTLPSGGEDATRVPAPDATPTPTPTPSEDNAPDEDEVTPTVP